jgi:hypothetical protein
LVSIQHGAAQRTALIIRKLKGWIKRDFGAEILFQLVNRHFQQPAGHYLLRQRSKQQIWLLRWYAGNF